MCNGVGFCECGECQCQEPYFGQYCELCSGDDICQFENCDDNALCASCVIEILDSLNMTGIGPDSLFTADGVSMAIANGMLPMGSRLTMFRDDDMEVQAIELPQNFSMNCGMKVNVMCPQLVIVDQITVMEYQIQSKYSVHKVYLTLSFIYMYMS